MLKHTIYIAVKEKSGNYSIIAKKEVECYPEEKRNHLVSRVNKVDLAIETAKHNNKRKNIINNLNLGRSSVYADLNDFEECKFSLIRTIYDNSFRPLSIFGSEASFFPYGYSTTSEIVKKYKSDTSLESIFVLEFSYEDKIIRRAFRFVNTTIYPYNHNKNELTIHTALKKESDIIWMVEKISNKEFRISSPQKVNYHYSPTKVHVSKIKPEIEINDVDEHTGGFI